MGDGRILLKPRRDDSFNFFLMAVFSINTVTITIQYFLLKHERTIIKEGHVDIFISIRHIQGRHFQNLCKKNLYTMDRQYSIISEAKHTFLFYFKFLRHKKKIPLIKIYRLSIISAGSISLDSTFKHLLASPMFALTRSSQSCISYPLFPEIDFTVAFSKKVKSKRQLSPTWLTSIVSTYKLHRTNANANAHRCPHTCAENPEAVDMNGRFQMQGGKNWILPE